MSAERGGFGPSFRDLVIYPAARVVPHTASEETLERQGKIWDQERSLDAHIDEVLSPPKSADCPRPKIPSTPRHRPTTVSGRIR